MRSAAPSDPLVRALEREIYAFLHTKGRYPILVETSKEIARLRRRSDVRRASHDAMIQIMRDCYDMLVIDLYSVRESLTAKDGVFGLLKEAPDRLWATVSTHPEPYISAMTTKAVRRSVKLIAGSTKRATTEDVVKVVERFRALTHPLDVDRNRVRAHRYQQRQDTTKFFLGLPKVHRQIRIIERYLSRLYLIVTHSSFSMELALGGARGLAPDLADIIVHGSINAAVNYYRPVEPTKDDPTPWYWHARQKVLRSRPAGRPKKRPG